MKRLVIALLCLLLLPALPLAISPASVMHLLPASRSELFVGIPVTVRVGIPYGGDTLTLAEHPVQPLTRTCSPPVISIPLPRAHSSVKPWSVTWETS